MLSMVYYMVVLLEQFYLQYINDLSNCITNQCKIFADYMKIYAESFSHDIAQTDVNDMEKSSNNRCLF